MPSCCCRAALWWCSKLEIGKHRLLVEHVVVVAAFILYAFLLSANASIAAAFKELAGVGDAAAAVTIAATEAYLSSPVLLLLLYYYWYSIVARVVTVGNQQ